jgi:hypothetical protein
MTEAFYERMDENRFRPTRWTRGPWGPQSQHGGPPAALLGRAIENLQEADGFGVARIVLDILRPVPLEPLDVTARIVRPGRSVQLAEALLERNGESIVRASAWLIRESDTLAIATEVSDPPPGPDQGTEVPLFATGYEGYLQAMEWRFVGGFFLEPGPATTWLRMRWDLVGGEPPSPLVRVLTAVDSASGISAALDFRDWLFVNPDLSVYLTRMPRGEWICLDAATTIDERGIGVAASTIHDAHGPIGRSLQSLFVSERTGSSTT